MGGRAMVAERARSAWPGWKAVVIALALVLPAAGGLVRGGFGWEPIGDNAIIMQRADDVGSPSTPLIGMPSNLTVWSEREAYHPGPMLFWLLAPAVALFGSGGIVGLVAVAAIRLGCTALLVAICWRRAGRTGALAIAVALQCCLLFGPELYEPLNPSLSHLAYALVPFLGWSAVAGSRRAAVGLAIAASFALQADLGFAPVIGATVLAVVLAMVGRRRAARRSAEVEPQSRWTALAVVLTVAACWSLPVIEAIAHDGGNLRALGQAFVAGEVPSQGLTGILGSPFGVGLVVAASVAAWSIRSHHRASVRPLAPVIAGVAVGYLALLWLQPTGGSAAPAYARNGAAVLLLFSVLLAGGPAIAAIRPRGRDRWRRRLVGAAIVVIVLVGGVVARGPAVPPPYHAAYGAPVALAAGIDGALARTDRVVVRTAGGFQVRDIAISTTVRLLAMGRTVGVGDGLVPYLGARRDERRFPTAVRVWVVDGRAPDPPVPGARLVARWRPAPAAGEETERLAAEVARHVAGAGDLELNESGKRQLAEQLRGWDDLAQAVRGDPRRLREAPGSVLLALYASGSVATPVLPARLAARITAHRAAHPLAAYVEV